jgi:hypothetical protein
MSCSSSIRFLANRTLQGVNGIAGRGESAAGGFSYTAGHRPAAGDVTQFVGKNTIALKS